MENEKSSLIESLKEATENIIGFKMHTPRDFDFLAKSIFNETRDQLSPTTLKRLWGYLQEKEQQTARLSTLNILSRYIGYPDWDAYCKFQKTDGESESSFLRNNCLHSKSLFKGDKVKLMWQPDRCVTIQHIGLNMFKVVDSKNSKLQVNDTFTCERIVENAPLLLSALIHNNGDPVNYICGQKGGVKFQIITSA